MLRKLLLPILATAALAGCATDYNYRDGNGDYYYGRPSVEYRYEGAGAYYGDFGYGVGGNYYYDRFGRLVYAPPSGYYGFPYYGGNGWYRPRPRRGHGDHDNHDGHGPNHGSDNHENRPPPWRDLGGLQRRDEENGYRNREDRQRPMPSARPMPSTDAPVRPQRVESRQPFTRQRSQPSSRKSGGEMRSDGEINPSPQ